MTGVPSMAFSGGSRVAFFGGSFDPPHRGHIAVARAARAALALDQVLFAPVGAQPLKPKGSAAPFEDRVAMTSLAIANEPGFEVSLLDAPASAPNYTIDTLHTLHAQQPAAQLFCLLGADSFLALRRWHRGAEIPFTAPLIVAARPGQHLVDLAAQLPAGLTLDAKPAPIPTPRGFEPGPESVPASASIDLRQATLRNPAGQTAPFYLLPNLHVDISASNIRSQLRTGHSADIAPAVLDYIAARRLYL